MYIIFLKNVHPELVYRYADATNDEKFSDMAY